MFEWLTGTVQGSYDALVNIPNIIAEVVGSLLLSLVYPFVVALSVLQDLWNAVYGSFANLVNAILSIPNVVINLINVLFVGVLPSIWTAIFVSTITVVVALRVYSFLKDIEIVGNKI
jgi:hypothetical protein